MSRWFESTYHHPPDPHRSGFFLPIPQQFQVHQFVHLCCAKYKIVCMHTIFSSEFKINLPISIQAGQAYTQSEQLFSVEV